MPDGQPSAPIVYWPRVKAILDGIMERWKVRWEREPYPGIHEYYWETPQQLAETFIADAKQLRAFAGDAKPLSDDFPLRLSPHTTIEFSPEFMKLLDRAPRSARIIDHLLLGEDESRYLRATLTQTNLRILPRLMLNSDPDLEIAAKRAIANGDRGRDLDYVIGVAALGDRDYATAEKLFTSAGVRDLANLAHNLKR